MAIGDWMKSEAWLANIGHVMAGALVALIAVLFTHNERALVCVECAFLAYVLVKEYVIDLRWESGETFNSSTVDAVGYIAGHAMAWALVVLAHALGGW